MTTQKQIEIPTAKCPTCGQMAIHTQAIYWSDDGSVATLHEIRYGCAATDPHWWVQKVGSEPPKRQQLSRGHQNARSASESHGEGRKVVNGYKWSQQAWDFEVIGGVE